jgi:hypothetical protein
VAGQAAATGQGADGARAHHGPHVGADGTHVGDDGADRRLSPGPASVGGDPQGDIALGRGRPPPQVAVGGVGELELGGEVGGQGVVHDAPCVSGVVGAGQHGGGPVEGEPNRVLVADEDDVGQVGQGHRRPHRQRAHVRIEGGDGLAGRVRPGDGQADHETERQGDGTDESGGRHQPVGAAVGRPAESTARNVRGVGARGDGSSRCSNIIYSFRTPGVQVVAQAASPREAWDFTAPAETPRASGHVALGPVGQIAQHHHLALSSG